MGTGLTSGSPPDPVSPRSGTSHWPGDPWTETWRAGCAPPGSTRTARSRPASPSSSPASYVRSSTRTKAEAVSHERIGARRRPIRHLLEPAGNLVLDELDVTVTAAFAIRFPRCSTVPGTTYKIGRWGDVAYFAPLGREDAAILTEGMLVRLTTLCQISFTLADVERIPGDQLFWKVVCDRCLIALRPLPEPLLL